MAKQTRIGLDTNQSKELAGQLNTLLANYQVFYINARGFHWNITGDKFFELHAKFEELYTDLLVKVDEVAERILTLGYTPIHTFSDYIQTSTIKEAKNISDGKKAMQNILDSFSNLISLEREILDLSDEANDEGTNCLNERLYSRTGKTGVDVFCVFKITAVLLVFIVATFFFDICLAALFLHDKI